MFPRGNAGSSDRSVAFFTVELTLFGGVGRTNKRRQELLKLNHVVNFRFIREMFCYTRHTAQRPGRCIGGPWSGVGILSA